MADVDEDTEDFIVQYVENGTRKQEIRRGVKAAMRYAVSLYERETVFPEGIFTKDGMQVVSAGRIADVYEEEWHESHDNPIRPGHL